MAAIGLLPRVQATRESTPRRLGNQTLILALVRRLWLAPLLALAAALVWQGFGGKASKEPPAAPSAPRVEAPVAERTVPTATAPNEPAAGPGHGPNEVELCGIGWIDKDVAAGNWQKIAPPLMDQARRARTELVARLDADPDPFARVTGTFVETWADLDDQRQAGAAPGAEACQGVDCPQDAARREALARLADQIARQAMATNDPRIYSLAFASCTWPAQQGACDFLSTRQWARTDPDNAAPWLYAFDEAFARKDASGVDDALFHIANAKRNESRFAAIAGEISRHAGADDSSVFAAYSASAQAIGVGVAQLFASPSLTRACGGNALDDANRRQVCERVAGTLADRSDTMLMSMIGVAVGRRLGWPVERRDALVGLQLAAADSWRVEMQLGGGVYSCDGMRTELRRFARVAEIGEMSQAREWLASTGRSQESYTRKARDQRLQAAEAQVTRQAAEAPGSPANALASAPR